MFARHRARWASCLIAVGFGCDCGGGAPPSDAVPFDVAPDIVDFGRVALGRSAQGALRIENQGLGSLAIERVEISEGIRAEIEVRGTPAGLGRAGLADLEVVFTPTQVGTRRDTITFVVDGERFDVLVLATVVDPSLVATPDRIDFGRVVVGAVATATVTLENRGQGRVKISALALEMGTSSEFVATLDNVTSLASGESLDFLVQYAPNGAGVDSGRVVVADDGEGVDPVGVALFGEAITDELEVLPAAGLQFEGVFVGETRTAELELRNVGSTAHEVTALDISMFADRFSVGLDPGEIPFTLEAGAIVRVPVRFAPSESGAFATSLRIESTGLVDPIPVTLIGIAVQVEPAVARFDARLDFGTITRGHATPRRFTITNGGDSSIDVRALRVEPPSAPFSIEDWGGDRILVGRDAHTLTVVATPSVDGPVAAELVFETDEEQRVTLTATATSNPAPDLLLEATALEFGWVPRGDAVVQRVDLRSVGPVPAEILEVAVSDPAFTVDAGTLPNTLLPGERAPIRVRYHDPFRIDGTVTATLSITTTDPDPRVHRVRLSATTIPPTMSAPAVEVTLTWDPPTADLDLHFVRLTGGRFDRPGDACFCNPAPVWTAGGRSEFDPRLTTESADGAVGERLVMTTNQDNRFVVHVHAAEASVPVTARVEVATRGERFDVLQRVLSESEAWTVGDLLVVTGQVYEFAPSELAPTSEPRDRCF